MTVEERARELFFSMDKVLDVKYRKTIIAAFEQSLRDQIEDCAQIIQDKIDIWRRLIGDSDESPLQELIEVLNKIRALAAPKEKEHDANEYKHSPWRCGCEEKEIER